MEIFTDDVKENVAYSTIMEGNEFRSFKDKVICKMKNKLDKYL
jgi:hypothetical protein